MAITKKILEVTKCIYFSMVLIVTNDLLDMLPKVAQDILLSYFGLSVSCK